MPEQRIATYVVLPDDKAEIEASATEVKELLAVLERWSIQTPEDEESAAGLMKEAHERHKELEKKRKELVAPALQAQRTYNDLFKPAISGWNEVKNITKRMLTDVANRREEERKAKLAEAAATGNMEQVKAPAAPTTGTAHRDEIEIKVVDFDQIPREYLCVDWSALKILVKNGKPAPPGVQFIRKTKVQVGR